MGSRLDIDNFSERLHTAAVHRLKFKLNPLREIALKGDEIIRLLDYATKVILLLMAHDDAFDLNRLPRPACTRKSTTRRDKPL